MTFSIRKCAHCGRDYTPTAPNQRNCSRECADAARRVRRDGTRREYHVWQMEGSR